MYHHLLDQKKGKGVTEANGEMVGEYQVRLEVYEGPLDLLLQLIERQEMDITQVSLARVADQYLEYIATMEQVEAENLAEFLVIAAKLLLIKSRALLPAPLAVTQEEEEEDVGQDLVEQLKLYRQFKQAAAFLQGRMEASLHSYPRLAPLPKLERHLDLTDVNANALAAVARQMLGERRELPPLDEVVAPILVSMDDKIAYIEKLITEQPQFSFQQLLRACASRLEIIITFLALLEMLKQLRIQVQQERPFGEIMISRQAPESAPSESPSRAA